MYLTPLKIKHSVMYSNVSKMESLSGLGEI